MDLKPLGDRIIVKQTDAAERTSGGLYISAGSQDKPSQGEVVAVGNGKIDDDGNLIVPKVKVGDVVIFRKVGGQPIVIDEQEYQILNMSEVFAVFV